MSARAQFFQKLETERRASQHAENKGQADIALFRLQMEKMHEYIQRWLEGAGLSIQCREVPVVELLLGNSSFLVKEIP